MDKKHQIIAFNNTRLVCFYKLLLLIYLCLNTIACVSVVANQDNSVKPPVEAIIIDKKTTEINNKPVVINRHKQYENINHTQNLYICDDISPYVGKVVGNGECVDLLKTCANVSLTRYWQEGQSVWENKIPSGTAIATFQNGKYPNRSGYHAAIYINQDKKGIYVWDQWRGKAVHTRLIKFGNNQKPSNTAQSYRVIRQRQ